MTTPVLLIEGDGPIRVVRLNRPEVGNAINEEMHHSLASVWETLSADPAIRVVVLTGAGKFFSGGGDINWFSALAEDTHQRSRVLREGRAILYGMLNLPVPIVAAVNGHAFGLGATLVSMCDVVILSEDAAMADPHVNVGLAAADGAAMSWPLLMGPLRAKAKILTGDRVSAQEALDWGLATAVVPSGDVDRVAQEYAAKLVAQPRAALNATRSILNAPLRRAIDSTIDAAFAYEDMTFLDLEHHERVAAFLAKRTGKEKREGS